MQAKSKHSDPKSTHTRNSTPYFGTEQSAPFFQAKLTVGQTGDKYEVEADTVADQVVNRKAEDAPVLQRMPISRIGSLQRMTEPQGVEEEQVQTMEEEEAVQRQEIPANESVEQEEVPIQRMEQDEDAIQKAELPASENEDLGAPERDEEQVQTKRLNNRPAKFGAANIGKQLRQRRGRGAPLSKTLNSQMSQAFNRDFSGVQIHTDSAAIQMSKALNAKAFTHGRDIYFNAAQFAPENRSGQHLLAHELTHVVQQGAVDDRTMPAPVDTPVQRKADGNGDDTIKVRPEALQAISLARTQVGKVNSKKKDGEGNRTGWQKLQEFFDTAFGGKSPIHQQIIQKVMTQKKDGQNKDMLPSWCGIFVWWAFKKSGIPLPDWKVGKSILSDFDVRKPGELPQKGDIAYDDQPNQHYGFVTGVESSAGTSGKPYMSVQVTTMNGNTAGDDNLGGQVQEQTHPISRWLAKDTGNVKDNGGAFFKTFSALDMPPAELVEVARTADAEMNAPQNAGSDTSPPELGPTTSSDPIGDPYQPAQPTEEQPAAAEEVAPEKEGEDKEKIAEPPPTSPQRPEDDPAFQAVRQKADSAKKKQKKHGVPAAKATAAQAASSIPVDLDVDSKAQLGQVRVMSEKKPNPFSAEQFADKVFASIKAALPKDDKETVDEYENPYKSDNKLKAAKQKMQGDVKAEKDQAGLAIAKTTAAEPNKENVTAKEVTPMSPEEVGNKPYVPKSEQAAPKPKTDQEISMEKEAQSLDNKMAENKVTETQLANSNEPAFTGALQQKKDAQKVARATPGEYRKKEEPTLADAQKNAKKDVQQGLGGMYGLRSDKLGATDTQKNTTKSKDEAERKRIAEKLQSIYKGTKEAVENKLDKLEEKVNKDFTTAVDSAMGTFKYEVRKRLKDHYGITVADDKIAEFVTGRLSPEIDRIFREEKKAFEKTMKTSIKAIATTVEQKLTEVTGIIAQGKKDVDTFWNSLSPELQKLGQEAKDEITGKFSELEQSVTDRFNKLADDLAKKYVEKVQTLREEFDKLKTEAEGWVGAAMNAVGDVIKTIINLKNMLLQTLAKAAHVIGDIIDNPIGFLKNLVTAVKMGLGRFTTNILTHLKKGLIAWLLGNMPAGIEFPKKWDLKGIFSFVMQILGLTWANIRARAVKKLGEPVVKALETAFEIFKIIATEGLAGLWKYIKKKIGDLKVMVMDAIKDFLKEKIIMAGIEWVIGLLNPAGAFIKACKMIYSIIMFFVERGKQIMALVNSVIDSVALIVQGNLDQAAGFVEKSLAKAIPVTIGFLASLLGLGGIAEKVQKIIDMVRKPINKAIDWVLDKAIKFAKKIGLVGLMKKGKAAFNKGKKKVMDTAKKVKGKVLGWLGIKKHFTADNGEKHSLYFKGKDASAKLYMASNNPVVFASWVQGLSIDDSTAAGKKRKKKKTQAIPIAQDIDKLKKSKPTTDAAKKALEKRIKKQIDKLSKLTGGLFVGKRPESSSEANGGVTFGSKKGGYGSSMTAKQLTNVKRPTGSDPTVTGNTSFDTINRRRSGNGAYYMLGHLLSNLLGGTGRKWDNLTPLTRSANGTHESKVEARVKNAADAGNIVYYKVTATYGRSAASSSNAKIQEVMTEEAKVAKSLNCKAEMINPDNDQRTTLVKATIDNNVDQKESAYDLVGGKKETVYLSDLKIDKIKGIQGVDQGLAEKIIAAIQDKGTAFATYAQMAEYRFKDNRRFTLRQQGIIKGLEGQDHVKLYKMVSI